MSNTNFKPGDRVLVMKEAVIDSMREDDSAIVTITTSYPFSVILSNAKELQPVPPFKRGDVVVYKRDHSAKPHKVLACFFDEVGDAVFVAESRKDRLFQCDNYELFTPKNDGQ